jgi:hypothetical protein
MVLLPLPRKVFAAAREGGRYRRVRARASRPASLFAACALALAALPGPSPGQPGPSGLRLSLSYDGRLIFKVLDIELQAEANPQGFGASSQLTSAGILAAFKHIDERATSQGRMVGDTPEPGVFDYQNLGGKTHRHVHAVWTGTDVAMHADPPFSNLGDPPASLKQKLAASDPLTVLMRVTLNATRQSICNRSYLFFDGKQLYALDFAEAHDTGATDAETRLGLVSPFTCDVRFREVAGFRRKPPEQRDQGLKRPIHVGFAEAGQGGPWVISNLRAATPLGWAVIELKRMSVSNAGPSG